MRPLSKRTLAVASLVVVVDHATKALARARLPLSQQIDGRGPRLAGVVGFERVRNAGAAAGFAQGRVVWIAVALVGAAIAVAIGASQRRSSPRAALAAGLILGGALGNVADRLVRGAVTDFIAAGDATHGACLNIADVALVVGTTLLIWCPPGRLERLSSTVRKEVTR